jgi:hypothetical protein
VQCCYLARSEIDSLKTCHLADYTLACADAVGRIAAEAKVQTLVPTHTRSPTNCSKRYRRTWPAGFGGSVLLEQDGPLS